MRNISASCFAASFIVLFWCIFLSRRCHDYGIFLISPRSPCVPGALQLQPSAGCACEQQQKKKKKKQETRKQIQHATSRICAVKLLMIARLPRFCRRAGREGGREGGETARSTQRPAEVRAQFTARFTSLLTLHKLAFLIRETGGTAGQCMPASQGGPSVRVLLSNH